MARFILFAILAALVVRALSRLARGMLEGAGYTRTPERPSLPLVRDPMCGVFVDPRLALTSGRGPAAKYFCSEKCRQRWTGMSLPNSATPNSQ